MDAWQKERLLCRTMSIAAWLFSSLSQIGICSSHAGATTRKTVTTTHSAHHNPLSRMPTGLEQSWNRAETGLEQGWKRVPQTTICLQVVHDRWGEEILVHSECPTPRTWSLDLVPWPSDQLQPCRSSPLQLREGGGRPNSEQTPRTARGADRVGLATQHVLVLALADPGLGLAAPWLRLTPAWPGEQAWGCRLASSSDLMPARMALSDVLKARQQNGNSVFNL